jgi:transcriptional regulator with XRE-family HTH domain
MSRNIAASEADEPLLSYVKELSGKRIELARKRDGPTQRDLARTLGMGVRWLREIESGNPKSKLDDHLRCTYHLSLSTGHILIPLLYFGQNMSYPFQLAAGDLQELERLCVEVISERSLTKLTRQLTPKWRTAPIGAGG